MNTVKHFEIIKKYAQDILESKGMEIERICVQHGTFSVFDHSLFVTSMCIRISKKFKIKVDERALIRGAMLHDYFLYDWHEPLKKNRLHGFKHPKIALENAMREYTLGRIEQNMILRHMFPLKLKPPKYREAVILCISDKLCATYETVGGLKNRIVRKFRRVDTNA